LVVGSMAAHVEINFVTGDSRWVASLYLSGRAYI